MSRSAKPFHLFRLHPLMQASVAACLSLALAGCGGSDDDDAPQKPQGGVKNVIVMINDGAGWGAWDAAAYWQYGSRSGTPYAGFPVRYGMTTFPLNGSRTPTGNDQSLIGYDAQSAWSATPTGNAALPFAGYNYLSKSPTDSAAAGTALASGIKTYNNAINYDNHGKAVDFVTLVAKAQGKATGVVTSVPFSHATPAAFGAQNLSRNNYHAIASQMLRQGALDLIMGTGAPGYNVNGTDCQALAAGESNSGCDRPYTYMSEQDWQALTAGKITPQGAAAPWRVIREKSDFEALAQATLRHDGPLIGLPKVSGSGTLQQGRQANVVGADAARPSGDAFIASVPSLATMTRGALAHLQKDADGLFLMVEGGATDWAAHSSNACATSEGSGGSERSTSTEPACNGIQYGRIIEETVDFNDAVAEVVAWVDKNSNWEETLLIVTTDHDNGMPMGPQAQTVPFDAVRNNGKGKMPGFSFRPTGDHANSLVPLWAKGAGAERFAQHVRGTDASYARYVGLNNGQYVDNTDVHAVVKAALTAK